MCGGWQCRICGGVEEVECNYDWSSHCDEDSSEDEEYDPSKCVFHKNADNVLERQGTCRYCWTAFAKDRLECREGWANLYAGQLKVEMDLIKRKLH